MTTPLLIFGGTFDPPHRAHVELPGAAARALGIERVVYLPAARNPQKDVETLSPDEDRVAMLRLALDGVEWADVSTIEIDRGGASYFCETLEALIQTMPVATPVRFLIGADHALGFHSWDRWERILELAEPAVMLRPPWDPETFGRSLAERYDAEEAAAWTDRVVRGLPMIDVSATEVRRRIAAGEPPDALAEVVDSRVVRYARERGLYADAATSSAT